MAFPFANINQYEKHDIKGNRRVDKEFRRGHKIQRRDLPSAKELNRPVQTQVILPAHEPKLLAVQQISEFAQLVSPNLQRLQPVPLLTLNLALTNPAALQVLPQIKTLHHALRNRMFQILLPLQIRLSDSHVFIT
jgi:hypothetical protein